MTVGHLLESNINTLTRIPNYITQFCALPYLIYSLIGDAIGLDTELPEDLYFELSRLLNQRAIVKSGSLELTDVNSRQEYINQLLVLSSRLKDVLSTIVHGQREKYQRVILLVDSTINDLKLSQRKNFLRPQPFGVIIGGLPGKGKSATANRVAVEVLKQQNVYTDLDQICVLNESDEFQSEFRTDHLGVIFDDLGATKTLNIPVDYTRKIIDFINNIPKTALNPHLELKGNIWIEPLVVVATTNLKIPFTTGQGCNTDHISCVEAINRRFKLKVYQVSYDTFVILDDHPNLPVSDKYDPRDIAKLTINTEQLLERVKNDAEEHFADQAIYLNKCYEELNNTQVINLSGSRKGFKDFRSTAFPLYLASSLTATLLGATWDKFTNLVSLQTITKYATVSAAFRQKLPQALTLSLFRVIGAEIIQKYKKSVIRELRLLFPTDLHKMRIINQCQYKLRFLPNSIMIGLSIPSYLDEGYSLKASTILSTIPFGIVSLLRRITITGGTYMVVEILGSYTVGNLVRQYFPPDEKQDSDPADFNDPSFVGSYRDKYLKVYQDSIERLKDTIPTVLGASKLFRREAEESALRVLEDDLKENDSRITLNNNADEFTPQCGYEPEFQNISCQFDLPRMYEENGEIRVWPQPGVYDENAEISVMLEPVIYAEGKSEIEAHSDSDEMPHTAFKMNKNEWQRESIRKHIAYGTVMEKTQNESIAMVSKWCLLRKNMRPHDFEYTKKPSQREKLEQIYKFWTLKDAKKATPIRTFLTKLGAIIRGDQYYLTGFRISQSGFTKGECLMVYNAASKTVFVLGPPAMSRTKIHMGSITAFLVRLKELYQVGICYGQISDSTIHAVVIGDELESRHRKLVLHLASEKSFVGKLLSKSNDYYVQFYTCKSNLIFPSFSLNLTTGALSVEN